LIARKQHYVEFRRLGEFRRVVRTGRPCISDGVVRHRPSFRYETGGLSKVLCPMNVHKAGPLQSAKEAIAVDEQGSAALRTSRRLKDSGPDGAVCQLTDDVQLVIIFG
jgi:hypothetical protein